jgi:Fic family protein
LITTAVALNNEPLSEDLIKRTHRILVEGIDTESGRKREQYAGRYRQGDEHVHAGTNNFVNPRAIPHAMRTSVEKFNEDFEKAESSEEIDPVWLAAKYSQDFVLIHPFTDGNGRTCRLILGAILLKYTGTLVAIGGDEVAREDYIGIVRRAGLEMEGPGGVCGLCIEQGS